MLLRPMHGVWLRVSYCAASMSGRHFRRFRLIPRVRAFSGMWWIQRVFSTDFCSLCLTVAIVPWCWGGGGSSAVEHAHNCIVPGYVGSELERNAVAHVGVCLSPGCVFLCRCRPTMLVLLVTGSTAGEPSLCVYPFRTFSSLKCVCLTMAGNVSMPCIWLRPTIISVCSGPWGPTDSPLLDIRKIVGCDTH